MKRMRDHFKGKMPDEDHMGQFKRHFEKARDHVHGRAREHLKNKMMEHHRGKFERHFEDFEKAREDIDNKMAEHGHHKGEFKRHFENARDHVHGKMREHIEKKMA